MDKKLAKYFVLGGLDGAEFNEIWSNELLHLKICNKVSWQNLRWKLEWMAFLWVPNSFIGYLRTKCPEKQIFAQEY